MSRNWSPTELKDRGQDRQNHPDNPINHGLVCEVLPRPPPVIGVKVKTFHKLTPVSLDLYRFKYRFPSSCECMSNSINLNRFFYLDEWGAV